VARSAVRSDGLIAALLRALPLILLAGLVGLGVPLALTVSHDHQRDDRRDAVVAAARAEVTNLMNIDYRTAARDLGRVIAGATGDLRQNYVKLRTHVQAIAQDQSVLTGSVVSAGLLWLHDREDVARAVLSATGTDSTGGASASVRHYRWVLTLRDVDGRWLVSDAALEGVPS